MVQQVEPAEREQHRTEERPYVAEVKPPQDGDVTIVWKNKKAVEIYIVVRTWEVPLQITISLLLDASLEAAA